MAWQVLQQGTRAGIGAVEFKSRAEQYDPAFLGVLERLVAETGSAP